MSSIIFNKTILPADTPCIRFHDRGLTLGHGLFETILIKKKSYPALDYHWRRLKKSAPILGIAVPFSYEELVAMLNELIVQNNLQNTLAGARITITQGEAERGILPRHSLNPNFLIDVFEHQPSNNHPYSALIVNTRKNEHSAAARVKSISYLDNVLAKQEAVNQGYDEAILLNTASNIADGSISNVFMVKENQIITPPVCDGALPGIVRAMLIENQGQHFNLLERSISPAELMLADEIFLSNALMGIQPVNKLNTKHFFSSPVADKLRRLLREKKNYI